MLKIIYNEDETLYSQLIEKVYGEAAKQLKLPKNTEVEINFVSQSEIKQLNHSMRAISEVTDVLSFPYLEGIKGKKLTLKSFPYDINPESGNLMLGEIDICIERLESQAVEYGHSNQREGAYLALHGLLHLLGYDHMTDEDKQEMRKIEEEILTKLDIKRN